MNDDLISRRDIKDHISELMLVYKGTELVNAIFNAIDNAPTVLHDNYSMGYQDGVKNVLSERPTGKWEWIGFEGCKYSLCQKLLSYSDEYDYETNYCPNCGSRREG